MISFLLAPIFWLIPGQFGVDAQVVSPTWRKHNISTSTADRIRIAGAALEQSINHIGPDGQFTDSEDGGWGQAGPFYSQMVEFDIATGQKKYEDNVHTYLALTQKTGANFSDETISHALYCGRAAARAYSAYDTQIFLDYAIQSWWFGRRYTLTQDNVDSGKTSVKDYPLTKISDGVTMAGGTFWANDTTDPDLSALPTGNFLVLSALLAEATSNPMYLQAASDAADFMHAHLYTSSHLVQDSISARQNDSCEVSDTWTDPGYSGLLIEGLSIIFSITKKASIQLLLNDLITVIPHTTWQQVDGILDNDHFFAADLVKGLKVAYERNVTSPQLRDWMKAYIGLQFNAVIDLATNGTNIYALKWQGPPSSTFDGGAQTDAINVLLSAISFEADSLPSSSTDGSPSSTGAIPPPSSTSVSRRSSVTGPIVGGVIGGIALLSCFVFVFWMVRRRQLWRSDGSGAPLTTTAAPMVFTPYTERPSVGPLSLLAPQRAKPSNDSFTTSPTSGSVGGQLDGATPGGEAEYPWNTQPWRPTSDAQSVDIPTSQLITLLQERLRNEGNQGQLPDYPPFRH
ncbi:hypothetical protein C8J57DRAFT_1526613 [Mycena rebaudengoi]|nr:hypothetical protein C8J57DRAFT_1526613 [Mycena rebaudengoi]